MSNPIQVVVVGAGHRSMTYASYAREHPDEMRVVGVVDPSEMRRRLVADTYHLSPDQCFESVQDLIESPLQADAGINGTMDSVHVPTTIPLLEAGYDVLLEKPFATNEDEMWRLVETAERCQRKVMICHVLRYSPFYARIRERIQAGEVGQVINVQTTEHVSYHHMAVGFVRGKWSSKERCHSSMLLAKCCHDLDLIAWMKSGVRPTRIASFGSNLQFQPDRAPEGAGTRCLVDCPIEKDCLYSARKHYLDHPDRWSFYVWDCLEGIEKPTLEDKAESLKTSPYGRCVWHCDNDVVDHQSVVIEFADGSTATHNMVGGSSRPSRSIHILGTHGEIQGNLEDSRFVVRHIDTRPGHEYTEETDDLSVSGDMHGAFGGHGGGDLRLVADFVHVLSGKPHSISTTHLQDSVSGHLMVFCADRAMEDGKTVALPWPVEGLGDSRKG